MTGINIDGEIYYELEEASKKLGLTKQSLKQYVYVSRKEELEKFSLKVGNTTLLSKAGCDYFLEKRMKNHSNKEPIILGGVKFESRKDACIRLGVTSSLLSNYLRVKRLIEKELEQAQ